MCKHDIRASKMFLVSWLLLVLQLQGLEGSSELKDVVRHVQSSCQPKQISVSEALGRIISSSDGMLKSQAESALQGSSWSEEQGFEYFDVTFQLKGSLGLLFVQSGEYLEIEDISPGGQASSYKVLQKKDQVVAVNFRSLVGIQGGLQAQVALIVEAKSPRVIRFRRRRVKQKKIEARTQRKTARSKPKNESPPKTSVEVVIRKKGPLGIVLLDDLSVKAVHSGLISETKMVFPGDVLVSINGKSTMKPSPIDAREAVSRLTTATLPKRLVFQAPSSDPRQAGDTPPIDSLDSFEDESCNAGADSPSEGFLRLVSPSILEGQAYPIHFALFGTLPRKQIGLEFMLQLSKPGVRATMACDKLVDDLDKLNGTLVLVKRGMCSFVRKARELERHGASGMLVISQEDQPVVQMPAGPHELAQSPVSLTAAMISHAVGSDLVGLVMNAPIKATFAFERTLPATYEDEDPTERAYVEKWRFETTSSGRQAERLQAEGALRITLWSPLFKEEAPTSTIESVGVAALFGSPWSALKNAVSVTTLSRDACTPLGDAQVRGSLVIIPRGKCPFSTKAIHVQNAGGIGILVQNNEHGFSRLMQMPGDPDNEKEVRIPSAMIDLKLGELLTQAFQRSRTAIVVGRVKDCIRYYCDVRNNVLC